MALGMNRTNATKTIKTEAFDTVITREEYAQICNSKKKKKGNKREVISTNFNALAQGKIQQCRKGH